MKIGILGGTGQFGQGLALRWAKTHEILIGSRDPAKAIQTAQHLNDEKLNFSGGKPIVGLPHREAVKGAEVIVLALRFPHVMTLLETLRSDFTSTVILSPVVPLVKKNFFQYAAPPEGSAALAIRNLLPDSCKVVAALHTIPAVDLRNWNQKIEGDVVVCGDEERSKRLVQSLIEEILDLRALDGGPLEVSKQVEPITPLILNLKQFSLKKDLKIKFI